MAAQLGACLLVAQQSAPAEPRYRPVSAAFAGAWGCDSVRVDSARAAVLLSHPQDASAGRRRPVELRTACDLLAWFGSPDAYEYTRDIVVTHEVVRSLARWRYDGLTPELPTLELPSGDEPWQLSESFPARAPRR